MINVNKRLLETFYFGIQNNEYFSRKGEGCSLVKNILKICRLLAYRFFFCCYKENISNSIKITWYPLHERILQDYNSDSITLSDHRTNLLGPSFLSYIKFSRILKILLNTMCTGKDRHLIYDMYVWRLIVELLLSGRVETIMIAGHYDKYATWIAYIAKLNRLQLTISQHGANSSYDLPHKIPANRVEVFSKAEEQMFRATILEPDNTDFYIKGFKSSISFLEGHFNQKTIAIASQPGYEHSVVSLIEEIFTIDKKINIIVYPHPSDRFMNGNLTLGGNVNVAKKERYSDIDFLLVFTSTLAYDYWSCPLFQGKVLCYYDKNCIVALYDDERAVVLYPDTFREKAREILV